MRSMSASRVSPEPAVLAELAAAESLLGAIIGSSADNGKVVSSIGWTSVVGSDVGSFLGVSIGCTVGGFLVGVGVPLVSSFLFKAARFAA